MNAELQAAVDLALSPCNGGVLLAIAANAVRRKMPPEVRANWGLARVTRELQSHCATKPSGYGPVLMNYFCRP
jgi:hypothetical protein